MSGFNLGDYVDVPTRLAMALKKFPDTSAEIIDLRTSTHTRKPPTNN